MGTFIDPSYIERLQEDIQIALSKHRSVGELYLDYVARTNMCQRLEEQGHESVVISLNDDGNFITGSKWGKEFVEDRYIFVTDFMQFCTDRRVSTEKADKDTSRMLTENVELETANPLVSSTGSVNSTGTVTLAELPADTEDSVLDEDTDEYDSSEYIEIDTSDILSEEIKENAVDHDTETGEIIKEKKIKAEPVTVRTRSLRKIKTGKTDTLTLNSARLTDVKVVLTRLSRREREAVGTVAAAVNSKEQLVPTVVETKEGHIKCSICNQFLSSKDQMKEHAKSHLTCDGCNSFFRSKRSLDDHVQRYCQVYNKDIKCEYCSEYCKSSLELSAHIEKEHEKRIEKEKGRFPCSQCKFVFNFEEHRNEHNQRRPDCKNIPLSAKSRDKDDILRNEITFKDSATGEVKVKTIQELLDQEKVNGRTCEICLKTFDKLHSYRRHIYQHSTVKLYTCRICFYEFNREENMKRHMKRHDNRPYYCENCFHRFETRAKLDYHKRINCRKTENKPDLTCKMCGYQAPVKSSLELHMRMHRGDKLSCSICNKKYTQKKSLSRHWQAAHSEEEQTYNCDVCSKAFKLQENLKRHMKMHGEKKHKCEICTYEGVDTRSLKMHMLTHTQEKDFICDVCGKTFGRKFYLDNHRRLHTGEKPFKCDFPGCDKAFRNNDVLKNHKTCHSANYGYVCDFCGKGFKVRNALSHHRLYHIIDYRWPCEYCEEKCKTLKHYKTHIVKAHPEKTKEIESKTKIIFYRCDVCPKIFSKKEHFDEHMNFHKGFKPWKCRFCEKGFCSKGNLRQHEKSHTGAKRLRCTICHRLYCDLEVLKLHLKTKHAVQEPEGYTKEEVKEITIKNKEQQL